MIFKGSAFDIVMNKIKNDVLYLSWEGISEFIDELLEMYYMKRRFGYYFKEKDIEIVDNKPAIIVRDDDFDDESYIYEGELNEEGYKVKYLEEIDKGHPFITENEKLKRAFI